MSELPVVEEVLVRLLVDGRTLFEWRCTPAELEALAVGRLYCEQLIYNRQAVKRLSTELTAEQVTITAQLEPSAAAEGRSSKRTLPPLSSETYAKLYRRMFSEIDARYESGGMHAAALTDGKSILYQVEDVGRHNAVDKVIGLAVLNEAPLFELGMLVSSRVSGEMAQKAVRSGVSWLASRSIPTTLAVRVARAASMPIIGRAPSKQAGVYQ